MTTYVGTTGSLGTLIAMYNNPGTDAADLIGKKQLKNWAGSELNLNLNKHRRTVQEKAITDPGAYITARNLAITAAEERAAEQFAALLSDFTTKNQADNDGKPYSEDVAYSKARIMAKSLLEAGMEDIEITYPMDLVYSATTLAKSDINRSNAHNREMLKGSVTKRGRPKGSRNKK